MHFWLESFDLACGGGGGGGQNGHEVHRDGVKIASSQQPPPTIGKVGQNTINFELQVMKQIF